MKYYRQRTRVTLDDNQHGYQSDDSHEPPTPPTRMTSMRFEPNAVQQRSAPPVPPSHGYQHQQMQRQQQQQMQTSLEPQIPPPVVRETRQERPSPAASKRPFAWDKSNKNRSSVQNYFDSPDVSRKPFLPEPPQQRYNEYDNPEALHQHFQPTAPSSVGIYQNGIPRKQSVKHVNELKQTLGVPTSNTDSLDSEPLTFQRSYREPHAEKNSSAQQGQFGPERGSSRTSTGFVVGVGGPVDLKSSQRRQSLRSQRSEVTFADHDSVKWSRSGSLGGSKYDLRYGGDPARASGGRRSGSLSNLMFNVAKEDNNSSSNMKRAGSSRSMLLFGSRGSSLRGSRGEIRRSGSFSMLVTDTLGSRSKSFRSRSGSRVDLDGRSEEDFHDASRRRRERSASVHELGQQHHSGGSGRRSQHQPQMMPKKSSLKKPKQQREQEEKEREREVQRQRQQQQQPQPQLVYSRSRQDLSQQGSNNGMVYTNYTSTSSSEEKIPEVIMAQRRMSRDQRNHSEHKYERPHDDLRSSQEQSRSQQTRKPDRSYGPENQQLQQRTTTDHPVYYNSSSSSSTNGMIQDPHHYELDDEVEARSSSSSRSSGRPRPPKYNYEREKRGQRTERHQFQMTSEDDQGHVIYPIPPSPDKRALYLPIFPKRTPKKNPESPLTDGWTKKKKGPAVVRHSGSVKHHIRDDETLYQTDL